MVLLALLACTELPVTDTRTPAGTSTSGSGQLALSFRLDTDYLALMDEEPVGTFYGSFWRGAEVSGIGPDEGAQDLGGIEVQLDLSPDGGPTATLFTSDMSFRCALM